MSAIPTESLRPVRKALIVVDDHPVLRRGLTALIESEPDLAVQAAVSTRQALFEAMRERQPDLVIVDLSLGDDDGLDLVKEIKTRYPKIPSLVLSMYDEALYAERSPIHHLDRLACPVIFFQGADDRVVPPNQTEMMVEALRRRGIPVGYLLFAGEQHGFRRAETIKRALDAELYFYAALIFRTRLAF